MRVYKTKTKKNEGRVVREDGNCLRPLSRFIKKMLNYKIDNLNTNYDKHVNKTKAF